MVSESVRKAYEAYADYIGCDVGDLGDHPLDLWHCADCETTVPVSVSDPHAYGPVFCPQCGEMCEVLR